jgi:hypothetical protein
MSTDPTSFVLRPTAARIVLDPQTLRPLASEGERKPRDAYWLRRLAEGSVEVVCEPAEASASKPVPDKPAKTAKRNA